MLLTPEPSADCGKRQKQELMLVLPDVQHGPMCTLPEGSVSIVLKYTASKHLWDIALCASLLRSGMFDTVIQSTCGA